MQQLHPKVLLLFFVKNFLATFYVIPIWFIAVAVFQQVWAEDISFLPLDDIVLILYGAGVIFFAMLIFACYYWAALTFTHFTYTLESDGLHIDRGVFFKRHLVIGYNQIEDAIVFMNPIVVRALGLYTLTIKTRQQENTVGIFNKSITEKIPGLTAETVNQLRNDLIKLSHVQPVQRKFFDPVSGKYH